MYGWCWGYRALSRSLGILRPMSALDQWVANMAYILSADTMGAYLACFYPSVLRPFPSHGGGRLCLSVFRFAGQGRIQRTLVGQ